MLKVNYPYVLPLSFFFVELWGSYFVVILLSIWGLLCISSNCFYLSYRSNYFIYCSLITPSKSSEFILCNYYLFWANHYLSSVSNLADISDSAYGFLYSWFGIWTIWSPEFSSNTHYPPCSSISTLFFLLFPGCKLCRLIFWLFYVLYCLGLLSPLAWLLLSLS